jgi:hypothetical protein
MARVAVRAQWAIPATVLVIAGLGTGAWLLLRDGGGVPTADLEAMLPEVVGKRPTVDWPRRVTCEGGDPAVCVREEDAGGDVFYLKEMINVQAESTGIVDLLRLFLEDGFEDVVVCPPAVSTGAARCTVGGPKAGALDVHAESAVYVR